MQEVMRTIAGIDRSVAAAQIPRYGLRKGIDPVDEWVRLGVQYRYERSVGAPHENAIKKVLDRADVMSQYDINLANRIQWFESMLHSPLAVGYRRVVRPYLSDGGTCGMCLVAADRVYSRHTLLPIHARCKCTVVPVLRTGEDIGSSLNNLDLGDLYEQAGGQQAESLKRTRYKIVDHGELGPQLAPVKTPKGPYAGRYKPTRSH